MILMKYLYFRTSRKRRIVATQYEKTAASFPMLIHLAAATKHSFLTLQAISTIFHT